MITRQSAQRAHLRLHVRVEGGGPAPRCRFGATVAAVVKASVEINNLRLAGTPTDDRLRVTVLVACLRQGDIVSTERTVRAVRWL